MASMHESIPVLLAVGIAVTGATIWTDRATAGRARARRTLARNDIPIWLQTAPITARLVVPVLALLVLQALVSRPINVLLVIPIIGIAEVLAFAAFDVPAWLQPEWLRAEVRSGATALPRLDRSDRFLRWVLIVLFVLGDLSLVALIVGNLLGMAWATPS